MPENPVNIKAGTLEPGLSKYEAVAVRLRGAIAGGQLKPGDRFPNEHELAEEFGVSRITIRQALQLLENDRLITRNRGIGTHVSLDAVDAAAHETRAGRSDHPRSAAAGPQNRLRRVLFVHVNLDGSAPHSPYVLQELVAFESYFSGRGVSFSWAQMNASDLIAQRIPPELAAGEIDGLIIDGYVNASFLDLGQRFGLPMVVAGSHALLAEQHARKDQNDSSPPLEIVAHTYRPAMDQLITRLAGPKKSPTPVALITGGFRMPAIVQLHQDYCEVVNRSRQRIALGQHTPDLDIYACLDALLAGRDRLGVIIGGMYEEAAHQALAALDPAGKRVAPAVFSPQDPARTAKRGWPYCVQSADRLAGIAAGRLLRLIDQTPDLDTPIGHHHFVEADLIFPG
ncbi:MAG: GntR family transcriptional regulator [Planctomycetota bacterium]